MNKYASLKLTTEYIGSVYQWRNIPLQYLTQFIDYKNKIRKVKLRMNTKRVNGAKVVVDFHVEKSARSSAGQSNGLLNRRS